MGLLQGQPGQLKSICSGPPLSPPLPHPPPASFHLWACTLLLCFQKNISKMLNYANLSFKTVPTNRPKHTRGYIHWPSNEHDRTAKRWGFDESQQRAQSLSGLSYLSRGGECRCYALPLKSCTQSGTQEHTAQACVTSYEGGVKDDKRIFVTVLGCSPSGLSCFTSLRKKLSLSAQFPKPCAKESGLSKSCQESQSCFPLFSVCR